MKKILTIIFIINIILNLFLLKVNANSNKGYFIVTAYYSPLPDQEKYLTGNYESEKRLNGQGIRGSSGKEVFSGMLAAPKNYKFGSKIYLEGLGIGEISDRGGAIVNAGNRGYYYDRIDVWVGYGDEGLRRALYWGKRKVKGNFVSNNTEVTLNYYNLPAPKWATNGLNKIPKIFSIGLGKGSNSNNVKKLQKLLKDVGLYNSDINGVYNNEVIDIIYDFQINNKIIKPGDYYGAGYWGKSTRALFLKKYLNDEFNETLPQPSPFKKKEKAIDLSVFESAANNLEKIKKLQTILKELNLYSGDINGIYKTIIDSVYEYQLSEGIVSGIYSLGAGSYGPITRGALKNTYIKYLENKKKIEEQRLKIEEENIKAEERKKELEEKYKSLKELSFKKAEEKLQFIGIPKFGDISHSVRELQITLKNLGFFKHKDTAIYGPVTKESIISYQINKNIILNKDDNGAGTIGPKTRKSLINDLQQKYLKEIIASNKINENELVLIVKKKT